MAIPADWSIVAFFIRPDLSDPKGNWRFLEEGKHSKYGVKSIETLDDRVYVVLEQNFGQIFMHGAIADETLLRHGIACGSSGGVAAISIFFKEEGDKHYRSPKALRYKGSNVGVFILGSTSLGIDIVENPD